MTLSTKQVEAFAIYGGILTGLVFLWLMCCCCKPNNKRVNSSSTPSYDKTLNVLN